MKRRREQETEIKAAIEELSTIYSAKQLLNPPVPGAGESSAGEVLNIPTRPLISLCSLILQVLDKIGPTMAVLRQDVLQNIQRLEKRLNSDTTVYSNVIEMLRKEAADGRTMKRHSCSKALLWLTRSLDMTVALLERLATNPNQSMEHAVEQSYNHTLRPWHGWISSAAFKVAINLLPNNKDFLQLISAKGENFESLKEDIRSLMSLGMPLLEDLHYILKVYGMDQVKHM
ncbi:hypothetical protein V2J09_007358 [Rumex salicifolius]